MAFTFAEGLLVLCFLAGLYYLLRPLQRILERAVLRFLGKNPKWIDAVIVRKDEDKPWQ